MFASGVTWKPIRLVLSCQSLHATTMRSSIIVSILGAVAAASAVADEPTALGLNLTTAEAGNPLFDGWYADPEIRVYDDVFWLYATTSVDFKDQKHFDAFSSTDLIHWYAYPCPVPKPTLCIQDGLLDTKRPWRYLLACFPGRNQLTA